MPKSNDNGNPSEDANGEILRGIARSLSILTKLVARGLQGDRKVSEMIQLLDSMGVRPVEIAEALGKTANDVNPVLSRARKSKGGGRKAGARRKPRR